MFNVFMFFFGVWLGRQARQANNGVLPTPPAILHSAEKRDLFAEMDDTWDAIPREQVNREIPAYIRLARLFLLPTIKADWRRELPGLPKRLASPSIGLILFRAAALLLAALCVKWLLPMFLHSAEPARTVARWAHTDTKHLPSVAFAAILVFGSFIGPLRWATAWAFPGLSLAFALLYDRMVRLRGGVARVPIIAHSRAILATYGAALALAATWPRHMDIGEQHVALAATYVGFLLAYALTHFIPKRFFPSKDQPFAFLINTPKNRRGGNPRTEMRGAGTGEVGAAQDERLMPRAATPVGGAQHERPRELTDPTAEELGMTEAEYEAFMVEFYKNATAVDGDGNPVPPRKPPERVPRYLFESAFPAVGYAPPAEPTITKNVDGTFKIDDTSPLRPPTK